jgi:hypothetical protein
MADDQVVWPVGTTDQDPDLSARPFVSDARGFLVAVLTDADEAQQAAADLRAVGFLARELRVFPGQQVLDDHRRSTERRSPPRRVVAAFTDAPETADMGDRAPKSVGATGAIPARCSAPRPL